MRIKRGRTWSANSPAIHPKTPDGLEEWRKERERARERRRMASEGRREARRRRNRQPAYRAATADRVRRWRAAQIVGAANTIPIWPTL